MIKADLIKKLDFGILTITSLFLIMIMVSLLSAQIAVKGEKIYTMNGEMIENGVILIKDDKISAVGKSGEIAVPDNYKIIEGKVVTPGLIDSRSVVGLAGIYNQKHDQDQLEKSDPIQPDLRAIDAYNPREELVGWIRSFGVTTINTGHAPGALISGQTMITKTYGTMESHTILDSVSMVAFSLGSEVTSEFKTPGSRPKGIAMLRAKLYEAKAYLAKKNGEENTTPLNIENEILGKVLNREIPALITADKAVDIMGALRLAEEFDLDIILNSAEEAYLLIDQIKNANVPVILHASMARLSSGSFETASKLGEAGILFSVESGYESYVPKTRVVLFEAGVYAANGLSFEDALASITINAAKILKIDDRVGSIEVGKNADVAIYNGDPFEYLTKCCGVIIDGQILEEECK
ncbi:MAG: amidohydrolase [Melioribacteraceae bacterium]|nr:MAG: amidohydrolase [Melioribacteraceae bacterium]